MRFLLNLIFALIAGIAVTSDAYAQRYTPLQPAHWGDWYNPDAPGEGLDLSLVATNDGNLIVTKIYMIRDGVQVWHAGQADWAAARDPLAGDYAIATFSRPEPGGLPEPTGTLWLRPEGQTLHAVFSTDDEWWETPLFQLTRPPGLEIGVCVGVEFSPPHPGPRAPDGWCH